MASVLGITFSILLILAFRRCLSQTSTESTETAPGDFLQINIDPENVVSGTTKKLLVSCSLKDVSSFGEPEKLSLFKRKNENPKEKIVTVSTFDPENPEVFTQSQVTVVGRLNSQGESFLLATFESPSVDDSGEYECEACVLNHNYTVVGFSQSETVEVSSPTVMEVLYQLREQLEDLESRQAEAGAENVQLSQNLDDMVSNQSKAVVQLEKLRQELDAVKMIQNNTILENEHLQREIKGLEINQTQVMLENAQLQQTVDVLVFQESQLLDQIKLLHRAELFYSSDIFENGKQYHISKKRFDDIHNAEEACQGIGGHLAVFEDENDLKQAQLLARSVGIDKSQRIIVGITDEVSEGNWVSLATGEPAEFLKMDVKNNNRERNCATFRSLMSTSYYKLDLAMCSDPEFEYAEPFICETTP